MRQIRHFLIITIFTTLLSAQSFAQSCDAHFTFDGNLADSSGNQYVGQMIGKDGAAEKPLFTEGKIGQALQLDGNSAMRAFIDLHFDTCPQLTIAAWIRVESTDAKGEQYIISTGSGGGPALKILGKSIVLKGSGNGLWKSDALRDKKEWFFVAAVYDYSANTYRLHWRSRSMDGKLNESRKPPEDALWLGAFNDRLASPTQSAFIDDLRIYGHALSAAEIRTIQSENAPHLRACDCASPGQVPVTTTIPVITPGAGRLPGNSQLPNLLTGRPELPYEVCETAGDCESTSSSCTDVNIPAEDIAGSFCTNSCSSDSVCPATNGFTGACYALAGANAVCYQRCDASTDCPTGNKCVSVTLPNSTLDGVCAPMGSVD